MVAISRRGQGGRIYNNTRARVLLRRKCVNPRRPHKTFPAKSLRPPPHSDTLFPSIFSLPSRALPLPHAAPTHTRRLRHAFPAEDLRSPPTATRPARVFSHSLPAHFRSPSPHRCIPRRRSSPAPAQRRALPEHFLTPFPRTSAPPRSADARPQAARCTPADPTTHFPPKICSRPSTATRPSPALLPHPRSADAHPPTSRPIPRRRTSPFPQRRPASPSVPLRAQKNGTAQWMCDAECLGRPSLRSVIGVGEPRAVRRHCGALAWRVGLRPQPWALRSRRCGRVLRA